MAVWGGFKEPAFSPREIGSCKWGFSASLWFLGFNPSTFPVSCSVREPSYSHLNFPWEVLRGAGSQHLEDSEEKGKQVSLSDPVIWNIVVLNHS